MNFCTCNLSFNVSKKKKCYVHNSFLLVFVILRKLYFFSLYWYITWRVSFSLAGYCGEVPNWAHPWTDSLHKRWPQGALQQHLHIRGGGRSQGKLHQFHWDAYFPGNTSLNALYAKHIGEMRSHKISFNLLFDISD